ncbi:MAG: response regulator [Chloroflexota bacterium]
MAKKILVVDDAVDSLKLIGLMLKRQGYEVSVADSGGKALQKADAELPDLIILDVMMPDMNGLDVCRRLRANSKTEDIPIIMFTAKTLIDDKVKGFEAGADDYLTKPTHPAELANRVKSVLKRKAAERASKTDAPETKVPAVADNTQRGRLMGVLGVKGGIGTTTVATNVAAALMQGGENPVVSDFRLGTGSMSLMLGIEDGPMATLIKNTALTAETVSDAIVEHESGLRALLSSANPHDAALEFLEDKPVLIFDNLREFGNPTIVDLGNGINRYNVKVIEQIDSLLYVVDANSISLQMAASQLEILDSIVGAKAINIVVVNRSQTTLPWHEAESRLNREVRAIISPAPELAFQAIEQAKQFVLLQPTSMVAGQFIKLADELRGALH